MHRQEVFFKKNDDSKKMSSSFEAITIESKTHTCSSISLAGYDSSYFNLYRKPEKIIFEHLDLKDLPYADEPLLNPEKNLYLKENNIARDASSRLAFRGQTLTIEMIDEVGGFHPSYARGVENPYHDSPLTCRIIDGRHKAPASFRLAITLG